MDTDHDQQPTQDPEQVPSIEISHQETLRFFGDDLNAALTPTNTIYVSVPSICKALGIKNAQPQVARILRHKVLKNGLRLIPILTRGGFHPTHCLRIDLIALWLAGIETSRMKAANETQQALQEKIERYQEELAPEATRVLLRVMGVRLTDLVPADQHLQAQENETEHQWAIATFMQEHTEALVLIQAEQNHQTELLEQALSLLERLLARQDETETRLDEVDIRTKRLTPAHTREVQLKVEHIARAIHRQQPTISLEKARAMIYGGLKTRFGAGSYKEIDDAWYSDVSAYLKEEYGKATGGQQLPEQSSLF